MPQFDLPLEKLRSYRTPEKPPADFDAFWRRTLAETAAVGQVAADYVPLRDPLYQRVTVCDVTFRGFLGQRIKGWFLEPAGNTRKLACLVSFIGYTGGRGLPLEHVAPVAAGFAHFVMDTRGQGSSSSGGGSSVGDTPDHFPAGGPQSPGFLTRGIDSPEHYYYRRLFTDAARAVGAAAEHPRVDARRIGVMGASQGGAMAIAAAALAGERVKIIMADVPFLSHFRRSITLVDTWPYEEIVHYLCAHRDHTEMVLRTLGYFDAIHFAPRVRARTLMSVGLMDNICPPSTVYAVYNRIGAKKEMREYPFNEHEGGGPFQLMERLRFAARHLQA